MPYATTTDLTNLGLSTRAQTGMSVEAKAAALDAASAKIDSYLAKRFDLPLSTWAMDLRKACVDLACYDLMSARGYSPSASDAEQIRLRYEDTMSWLRDISRGHATPQGVDDGGGDSTKVGQPIRFVAQYRRDDTTGEFAVTSPKPRGW